jgi:hypothetical protein
MQEVRLEIGRHVEKAQNVRYTVALIKHEPCFDGSYDDGIIIKEAVLEKGMTLITAVNVR